MISTSIIAAAMIWQAAQSLEEQPNGSALADRLAGEQGSEVAEPGSLPPPEVATHEGSTSHHDVHVGDIVMEDILVGEGLQQVLNADASDRRRATLNLDFLKWDNGVAKYAWGDDYPEEARRKVRQNMDRIELLAHPERKCVRFEEDPDADHVAWVMADPNGACYARIGKDKWYGGFVDGNFFDGKQGVSLGPNCLQVGVIQHELLHMLGFVHEQARTDRDEYVDIKWENIKDGKEDNFWKAYIISETHGTPYDYMSLMHYGAHDFTKNGKPTIETKDKEFQNKIGQRDGLSELDIYELRRHYDCPVISEENCECQKNWTRNGETVNHSCGNPDDDPAGDWCPHVDPKCGSGRSRCKPMNDLWDDGSICGLGTTCNYCKHKATYWYGKAFTACGEEPKWGDGTRCLAGTSCNNCRNSYEWWDSKFGHHCGKEPKWDDGTRCAAGTTCENNCKNGYYEWWHGIVGHACGKEPCWGRDTACYGTACRQCCDGAHQPWYWFGGGKCE